MNINCILRTVARISLGVLFVFSGYTKVVDPIGFAIKFGEYFDAMGLPFLKPAVLAFGILLPVAETAIGICFLLGINMRLTALAGLLFMAFFTPLTFWLAITDAVKDCGCFGDAVKLSNWETFYKNLILLPIAVYIFAVRKKYKQLFNNITEIVLGVAIVLICTGISIYAYRHLPQIDFMAYKVGVNILDDMEMKEDAPQDIYDHTFIYEKNGNKETFTIENLPDSSWTFISTEAKLIKEGYVPPTRDFVISNPEGDYAHEELLSEEGYLMFLTSHEIRDVSYKNKDKISLLKKNAEKNGVKFIMLSGSTDENNQAYLKTIGEEYPIYYSDETVIKSMVRSNPGIMLLKDGVIIKKWSDIDTPSIEEFSKIIAQNSETLISKEKKSESRGIIIAITILSVFFLIFSYAHIRRYKLDADNYY